MIGLAPSAAAAEVLAGELGIGTDNTAKWLTEASQARPRRRTPADRSHPRRHAYPSSANAERLRERASLDAGSDRRTAPQAGSW